MKNSPVKMAAAIFGMEKFVNRTINYWYLELITIYVNER